jgi:hypothetical protein
MHCLYEDSKLRREEEESEEGQDLATHIVCRTWHAHEEEVHMPRVCVGAHIEEVHMPRVCVGAHEEEVRMPSV